MNFIRMALRLLLAMLIAGPAWAQEQSAPPATLPAAQGTRPAKETHPPRIRVPADVQEKNLVHRVVCVYPDAAMSRHITGTVLMHVIVSQDGTVQKVDYISGPTLLKNAAMYTVKEWKYKPTMVNGQPVEVDTTVKIVFSL